jgi:hypothetical protein
MRNLLLLLPSIIQELLLPEVLLPSIIQQLLLPEVQVVNSTRRHC